MKKLILIIAIAFSGMLMQAQSIRSLANENLNKPSGSISKIVDSDYGKILLKCHSHKKVINKVRVTAIIGSDIYNEVIRRNDYQQMKVGEFRVDFIFLYSSKDNETLPMKSLEAKANSDF